MVLKRTRSVVTLFANSAKKCAAGSLPLNWVLGGSEASSTSYSQMKGKE